MVAATVPVVRARTAPKSGGVDELHSLRPARHLAPRRSHARRSHPRRRRGYRRRGRRAILVITFGRGSWHLLGLARTDCQQAQADLPTQDEQVEDVTVRAQERDDVLELGHRHPGQRTASSVAVDPSASLFQDAYVESGTWGALGTTPTRLVSAHHALKCRPLHVNGR